MDICLNTVFLRILYYFKLFMTIIKFAIPLLLIIKITIDVYKKMINPEMEVKNIKNRIIAAIIIFLVPTVVDGLMGMIGKIINDDYNGLAVCYEFANLEYIEAIEEERREEELEEYLSEQEKALNEREKQMAAYRRIVESRQVVAGIGEYANNKNMIQCNSGSQYNTGLFNAVRHAGYKSREGVVAAALYLSSHINIHIPYFWSGGHFHTYSGYNDSGDNFIGISDKWGCDVKMMSPGTDKQKPNNKYPFGMDCNGFVAWAIFNGGYYTGDPKQKITVSTTTPGSIGGADGFQPETISFSQAKGKVKPGDIAYKDGHVGLVVEVNDQYVSIAEEKGYDYGLVISKQKYGQGGFTHIALMDNFYNNYKKDIPLYSIFK